MDKLKTINNNNSVNNNDFKTFFESKGLMFGKRLEKSQKTKQQKLIDSISKEIKIMSKRTDLNLLLIGDDENKRSELRFHNKPNGNLVEFNLKYKSKIVRLFDEKDETMKCENNLKTYLSYLETIKEFVESMDKDDKRFDVIG
tara:strand:+ start:1013 stop:1441 length:429 start_codon:yes stop_codon:yes gene_type:complete